jgi:hypothetical protein
VFGGIFIVESCYANTMVGDEARTFVIVDVHLREKVGASISPMQHLQSDSPCDRLDLLFLSPSHRGILHPVHAAVGRMRKIDLAG